MPTHASEALSDLEVQTSRLLDASRERVLAAWLDPARLARWWGPEGFTNSFEVCEPRAGGAWRFVMHAPNGAAHPNESVFREVGPDRVVVEHLSAPHFVLTATLEDEGTGTRVTWRQRFDSAETCRKLQSVVVPANEQNLDRLAAEVARE